VNINEIKEKSFETSMRGYRQEEVHNYLDEICGYIKGLLKEKEDLLKKMEILAHKVEEYRNDEESIQEALLGAQKLGKSVVNEANQKAEELRKQAEEQVEKMVSDAKTQAEQILSEARAKAQEMLVKSKSESDKLTSDARQNVENIVRTTKYEIDKEQTNLIRMQKEVSTFKSQLLELYRDHIDLIKKLPEMEPAAPKMQEQEKEVRDLNKDIYEQQKSGEKKSADQARGVVVNTQTITSEGPAVVKAEAVEVPGPVSSEPEVETFDQPDIAAGLSQFKIQETKEYDRAEMKTVNEQYRAPVETEKPSSQKPEEKQVHAGEPFGKVVAKDHYYKSKYGKLKFGGNNR
jgi:cell division initiation protein